jgi:hypothetical protein
MLIMLKLNDSNVKNRTFLFAVAVLALAVFDSPALASALKPEAYKALTAVELSPALVPRLRAGTEALSGTDGRYAERLPVQLDGALKRVSQREYRPTTVRPRY